MNSIGLARLLYNIYKQDPLDVEAIQRQGLLAVKIGQTFALRIDFLDAERCNELTKLYRSNIAIPAEDSEALIRNSVSSEDGWFDHFAEFNFEPFATASVGQAHVAQLTSGEEVVVKVVKGNFKQSFLSDIKHAKRLMRTAIFFYPRLDKVADPMGILGHIEEYTVNELNLLHEIEGHDKLKAHYDKYKSDFDLSRLAFPKVYRELSNEQVLVTERLTGKTVDELLQDGELVYEDLLEIFHVHGFYLFGIGEFHGDIHPGNLIMQDGKIYFIDTGAIGHVGDTIRVGLFDFFDALSQYDFEKSAYYLNQMAEQRIEGKRYEKFQADFVELYKDFKNSTVSEVSLTQKMMHTIKMGVESGMVFEKGMYGIIKSMMYLDGMVLRCNPDAVLMKDMRPYLDVFRPFVTGKK